MKQFMGFKANATAKLLGTNADPAAATTPAVSPEQVGTALPGAFGVSKTTGLLIPLPDYTALSGVDKFVMVRGNPKDSNPLDTDDTKEGATISDEIDRRNFTVKKYIAVAGASKVITLGVLGGNNLIGGAVTVTGAMAGITVVDTSPNIMTDWKVRTYEVKPVVGADAAAVATALAAKIMADPDRIADAAAATTTLVLTNRTKGKTFDAHGTDGTVCEGCTKVITTKPISVDNTILSMRELELECAGYQGVTRRGDGQLGDILPYTQVEIDAVGGFVVYHLVWERNVQRQGAPVDARASRYLRLYLSVPTNSLAMITSLDALFGAAMVTVAGLFEEDEEGTPLLEGKEANAERKRFEKEAKEVEKEEKEAEKERGKATQLPAEQPQRERGHAEQLPAEQKEREAREAKEREERERAAHRDGHKH